jgi:hypothetical protein
MEVGDPQDYLFVGRKKQLDTSMNFCPYEDCINYGKVGDDNQIIGAGRYPQDYQFVGHIKRKCWNATSVSEDFRRAAAPRCLV